MVRRGFRGENKGEFTKYVTLKKLQKRGRLQTIVGGGRGGVTNPIHNLVLGCVGGFLLGKSPPTVSTGSFHNRGRELLRTSFGASISPWGG